MSTVIRRAALLLAAPTWFLGALSSAGAQLSSVPVPVPPGNPISAQKAALGKVLFWDEQLSSTNTVACGTCHIPAFAGSDPRLGAHPGPDGLAGAFDPVWGNDDIIGSEGVVHADATNSFEPDSLFGLEPQVTGRAAPSVIGSQWSPELFWDGRASGQFLDPQTGAVSLPAGAALESQAVAPILSATEMGHEGRTWAEVVAKLQVVEPLRLATDLPPDVVAALAGGASYPDLFQAAFGSPSISADRIGRAIATYERTLVPDESPWDLFMEGNPGAMTQQQFQGWNMLQNNTVCLNCHVPPLFTDNEFWNIGLRPGDEDIGRMGVTGDPGDKGRFKTPTLRNVGLKSAMMHVGWIADVQDSIDFYNAPAQDSLAAGEWNEQYDGFVQWTADQTGIPTAFPGFFADYNAINMPVETAGGVPMQAPIMDFIANALTDPRVASELPPFDRPTLNSEAVPMNPDVYGVGSAGSGGHVPQMVAVVPLNEHNPDFKVGVGGALGGSVAFLAFSLGQAPPGSALGGIPLNIDPLQLHIVFTASLAGAGPGQGYGTVKLSIGSAPAAVGLDLYAQWLVVDGQGPDGVAVTRGAHWTVL